MADNKSWAKIFNDYRIIQHNFDELPYAISSEQIKNSCQDFKKTTQKEVRILCKQHTRESRPGVFKENNLFLLPVKNGLYNIIKGEGYVDIPEIRSEIVIYKSKLDFRLDSLKVMNSKMQHLDYAYASSLIRTFMEDDSLVLTIRGRKYTPRFDFYVNNQLINVSSVQTEVDAGYEGRDKIVLIEAKNSKAANIIIRQLYYPFRQWQSHIKKKVVTLFFEKVKDTYSIWQFGFNDIKRYDSIKLVKARRYKIIEKRRY